MDFKKAEQYLLSFTDYEKIPGIAYTAANYDLRRMELLLEPLGNPHKGTNTVHIAGTKGKGSTAAMIAKILTVAGYSTGLFTSPHLHTIRERARINDELISEDEFASIMTEIKPIVERVCKEAIFGQLTTFEILTAMVFTFFKKHKVDFQVLEVGLGGRLDATNIARGDVCVITSISYDHTEILGSTLTKIATEKAGIIKPGSIVVNFPQKDEVTEVIEKTCKKLGNRLIQVGKDIRWKRIEGDLYHQSVELESEKSKYKVAIPLLGDFQMENTAAAIAAAEVMNEMGNIISEKAILTGLQNVEWQGRMQILKRKPLVVADGAHNAYSMFRLIESVKKYFSFKKCHVIFGSSSDKDIDGMAKELVSFTDNILITSSAHPRAATCEALLSIFKKYKLDVKEALSIQDAINEVMLLASKDDLILITGSLFVVAEAIRYMHNSQSNS